MCGICGFNQGDLQILSGMLTKLHHRGPDDEGRYVNDTVSLGMRRLAIIDLITGQQPVWNEDKSICVILNGEIYNYKQLRNQLLKNGHQLSSVSDSEVLVHLYEDYKLGMFAHLEGMFAFCILDIPNNKLILARDRFGEKPLYYYSKGNDFAFASEMQSLLEYPRIQRKLNTVQLESLLNWGYSLHPETLIQDVYTLSPGYYLEFQNGTLKCTAYDQWNYDHINEDLNETDALEKARVLLFQSVEKQMVSDVPIGAFLSGGIDSSTVSAIMQQLSPHAINTFNVKFEETSYDESPIAKKVAQHLGTKHHEIFVPNAIFQEDLFWDILMHVGQPFVDSSCIPSYFISKEIQRNVKVVLSGDGGDELFGGYDDFKWGDQIQFLRKFPTAIRQFSTTALKKLPDLLTPSANWKRGVLKALEIAGKPEEQSIQLLYELFSESERSELLKHALSRRSALHFPDRFESWSTMRKLMWFRTAFAMPDDMLVKVDRMSMRHSIEVRAPFLDKNLFDFAATLPKRYLRRGNQNKWIIRQVMKNDLPKEVFSHPKQGFNFPLHKFFTPSFRKFTTAIINKNHPLFKIIHEDELKFVIQTGLDQNTSTIHQSVYKSAHKLWILIQLFAWTTHYKVEIETS